jgi:ribonuclease T2
MSAQGKKYAFAFGVLLVLFVILEGFIFQFEGVRIPTTEDDDTLSSCYLEPTCTILGPADENGFTNATGWSFVAPAECCQICLNGTAPTVCFDSNGSCANKTGDADYDYLLLDEIWMPQFCIALDSGYDPTLSHTASARCQYRRTEMSIHGLWPNYVDGYPQCCNASGALEPLNPQEVELWTIQDSLQNMWYDPTVSEYCSTCYLLNHEWEKHGGCFSPGKPETYFKTGLLIHSRLLSADASIKSLAGRVVDIQTISDLYVMQSNIICDPNDPEANILLESGIGVLLEVQTCWARNFSQINCGPAFSGHFTFPCPSKVLLRIS